MTTARTTLETDKLMTRRGRQRTPKPWLMAGLCRLGLHQGQWAFVAQGNCTQGRECGRCGSVHVRTKHQREWRYTSQSTCEQERTCRCNALSSYRTKHQPEWWYVSDGRCEQVRSCTRCEAVSGGGIAPHVWSASWEVEHSWWDKEAHRCLRCGVVEEWHVSD